MACYLQFKLEVISDAGEYHVTTTRPESIANPLLAELEAIHRVLRNDLRACRRLAREAASGAAAAELRKGLAQLDSRGLLFQLRANCLGYCQLVHRHHGAEDLALFPAVRRDAPHLASVLDRLEADHRTVSDLLDEVESAVDTLDDHGDGAAPVDMGRFRLITALTTLSTHLLEHLDREEEALAPVLAGWERFPNPGPRTTDRGTHEREG